MRYLCLVLIFASQVSTAADLISCKSIVDDANESLRVYETDNGFAYEATIKPMFGRGPLQPYHSSGPIGRVYAGTTPTLGFESGNVAVYHIFGAEQFENRVDKMTLQFNDSDCTVNPGSPIVQTIGRVELGLNSCDVPDGKDHLHEAEEQADALAIAACNHAHPVRVTQYETETSCKNDQIHVRASAMYRCDPATF